MFKFFSFSNLLSDKENKKKSDIKMLRSQFINKDHMTRKEMRMHIGWLPKELKKWHNVDTWGTQHIIYCSIFNNINSNVCNCNEVLNINLV